MNSERFFFPLAASSPGGAAKTVPAGLLFLAGLAAFGLPAQAQVIATFDDLASPPALDGAKRLIDANGGSASYRGVLWDTQVTVAGRDHQISSSPGTPKFGIPHSGDFYVTNGNGSQGIQLTTAMVLTGAWFGRNEYYGYGGGADSVTIKAMDGGSVLASITYALPLTTPGQPEPLTFFDTSAFASLSGITGYLIDHHAPRAYADNWIADDFKFATVPEPGSIAMVSAGALAGLVAWRRLRRGPTAG